MRRHLLYGIVLAATLASADAGAQQGHAAQAQAPDAGIASPDRAVALFIDGKLPEAKAVLDACAPQSEYCRTLGEKMRTLEKALQTLDASTDDDLQSLLKLDREIGAGKTSKQGRRIGAKLAHSFTTLAMKDFEAERFQKAALNAIEALKAEPENEQALALLRLSTRAYLTHADDEKSTLGDFPPYVEPFIHGGEAGETRAR